MACIWSKCIFCPFWVFDVFFVGCCLGKWYNENMNIRNKEFSPLKVSVFEVLATVITVFAFVWCKQKHENVVLIATQNWTTIYIPLAVMWIILFVYNKGIITKLLTNRITVFIGNISAYTFLIHYVITQYINLAKKLLNIDLSRLQNILLIFIELFITVVATVIYMKITNKKVEF